MIRTVRLLIVAVVIAASVGGGYRNSKAQPQILEKHLYTNMDFPIAAVVQQMRLWVATSGGVYWYEPENRNVSLVDPQQLFSIALTAIAYDSVTQQIVLGSDEGYLQIYDLETRQWTLVPEIFLKRAEYGSVAINTFLIVDTIAIIGCDFGLVLFDLTTHRFIGTLSRLLDIVQPKVLALAYWQDSLWVGTPQGIFVTALGSGFWLNPNDPARWSVRQVPDYQPVVTLVPDSAQLFVGTQQTLYRYKANTFQVVHTVAYPPLTGLVVTSTGLYIADRLQILEVGGDVVLSTFPTRIRTIVPFDGLNNTAALAVLTEGEGVWILRDKGVDTLRLNTIAGNIVGDIAIAPDGAVWYATDIDGRGRGFGWLQQGYWHNFRWQQHPELETNDWYRIFVQRNGTVWVSSWGKGLLQLPDGDPALWKRWNHRNAPLTPFQDDFVVVGDVTEDVNGTLWVTNPWGNGLVLYQNNQWFSVLSSLSYTYRFTRIVADPIRGVWFASHLSSSGLWYADVGSDVNSALDDRVARLTVSDGLLDNQINALLFDSNGWLWIGTPKGLQVLLNPQDVADGADPLFYVIDDMSGQTVFVMDVDPTATLWVGTHQGIWLLDLQSLEVRQILSDRELRIFDPAVLALQFDDQSGWVYVGTKKGLLALRTTAVQSLQVIDSVRCFPQPFYLDRHSHLTITNLPVNAVVHIVTASGEHVREIVANNSAMVIWNGTDQQGRPVSTGVYYVLYFSETLNQEGMQKIVVVGN